MAKTTLFKGVVYLSDDNYAKLVKDGVIEVGGQTVTYDESMVYVTPKALGGDYYTKNEVEEKLKTVFDNVTYLDNSYGEQNVLYDTDDGITIMQTTRVVSGDKTSDISSEITIPLVGSDEIVFDATEDGSHIQAHLDMDITNKLARTLVTPLNIPANTELVAVDNTGSQKMLELGDGLSVENGTLKASGNASGGSKLYRHNILIQAIDYTNNMNIEMGVTIINSDNTVFNYDTFSTYIANNAEPVSNRYFNIHGYADSIDGTTPGILGYLYIDSGIIRVRFLDMVKNSVNDLFIQPTSSLITDNLVEV